MVLDAFQPAVRQWFQDRLGEPTAPQVQGWPLIREGHHALIAAPTGTGKTLAAFLDALDRLFAERRKLPDETRVLYVSPLKALGNDVQKNLERPLAEIRELDPTLPAIRVQVRSGDTPASERAKMLRKPPHILVTTPESLYILLTSAGGRELLRTVRTVIVDEIHATLGDKRGSHLALSLERLSALAGEVQRIGLSATQKPIADVARYLVGKGRECRLVDVGHRRDIDVAVEVTPSPLAAVCSHEQWEEVYGRVATLIDQHRTTLIFVNTRKLAERVSARLAEVVGEDAVRCHHSSLSKDRRLEAEQKLKGGELRALVATASLELGIDVGDVDLVIQIGTTRSIATFLQRVGRAGHAKHLTPKGRLFPLTRDELVEAAALMQALADGELDRTPQPAAPLDVLVQQVVAECVAREWGEDALFAQLGRAWPYRELTHQDFEAGVELHTRGRAALLHRDGVNGRLMATRRARLTAMLNGGTIPDTAEYRVVEEPAETFIGTVDEDFAVEASGGDVFQLGNSSWRVLKVDRGVMRVADAGGAPPSLPFWLGEAPARTEELSAAVASVREQAREDDWATPLDEAGTLQVREYVEEGVKVLGAVPTRRRVVLERFFDESGGMQLVLHAPFGGRINRAWGYALRKSFCRGFGFELQAASNEDAVLLSLGPQHSFPLEEVFQFLSARSVEKKLIQAILPTPMFKTRWRWNVTRALMMERMQGGKRVPAALQRMRADDLMVQCFPQVMACPETLPGGDLEVPMDHPIVRQTIEDCLHEAMDLDGLVGVLEKIESGEIQTWCVDTATPSVFAHSILNAMPYAFLDDAPLEERRTQAVMTRRGLDSQSADQLGALDPAAVARVREEAWPRPQNLEEVHEALLWMGYLRDDEAGDWAQWLQELQAQRRVVHEDGRWMAVESTRDPREMLRGRLEALGPVFDDDPLLFELEAAGVVLRTRIDGREAWCDRRLLARIHRYTLDRLRREIEPVSATVFLRFLARWQHVDPDHQLDGPRGVVEVVRQLAGLEVPAAAWEAEVLPARVKRYRREWLDEVSLNGEVAWGRLWGAGRSALRTTPLALLPREDLDLWLVLRGGEDEVASGEGDEGVGDEDERGLSGAAQDVYQWLRQRGAMFPQELQRVAGLLPVQLEDALGELIAQGLITGDGYSSLRQLVVPPSRRKRRVVGAGRWSLFQGLPVETPPVEFLARQLLQRWGVVFRKLLLRERLPVTWGELLRVYRTLELRGDVRGGRFVGGFSGEQFALPEAVKMLRAARRDEGEAVEVAAGDPLNLRGILTPDERVATSSKRRVSVG